MIKRTMTSIVLLSLIFSAIYLLPTSPYINLMMAMIVAIGAWEWSGFCYNRMGWRLAYSFLTTGLFLFVLEPLLMNIIISVTAVLWVLGFLRLYRFNNKMQSPVNILCSGMILLIGFALSIVALHQQSVHALMIVLCIVISADILGLFVGRKLGKQPLVLMISPQKTWEGVYGALTGAVLLSLLLNFIFNLSLLKIISIGVIVTLVSILGDLFISCYKREAGMKNTGTLLPGHGGLLDRIDGLLAAAPVFWALVTFDGMVFTI